MPPTDAAWLHMDRPTGPMVVNTLILFAETPDFEEMAEVLQHRLVDRFPRFRQRVVNPLGRPAFEDDPYFDVRDHLGRLTVPGPGDRSALEALLGELIAPPLEMGRPLWEAYLIDGYEEGAAILWRIHHCLADGIALSRVLLSTADDAAAIDTAPPREPRGALGRIASLPGAALSALRRLGGAAVHEGMETLAHPGHLRELADTALRDASIAAKLLGAPADPPTGLRATPSGRRRVSWSERFPLAEVKEAGRRRGVTINDVVLAALVGALGETLGDDGELPEEIHTMIPVDLRSPDDPVPAELGNEFALVLLGLPLGLREPEERLREVHRLMGEIKDSHEASIAYGLINAMGLGPDWAEGRLIEFFTDKASLVVTNVPGPSARLSFAGAPITGVLVWAPCSGSLGATISIFSYAGEISAGFMSDTALSVSPDELARGFEAELRRLLAPSVP